YLFSSRRRHTRFSRDWSSDVCSSDLVQHVVDHLLARQAHDVVALRLGLRLSRGPCPLPLIAGEGLGAAQQVVLPDGRTLLLALQIGRASCREGALDTVVTVDETGNRG